MSSTGSDSSNSSIDLFDTSAELSAVNRSVINSSETDLNRSVINFSEKREATLPRGLGVGAFHVSGQFYRPDPIEPSPPVLPETTDDDETSVENPAPDSVAPEDPDVEEFLNHYASFSTVGSRGTVASRVVSPLAAPARQHFDLASDKNIECKLIDCIEARRRTFCVGVTLVLGAIVALMVLTLRPRGSVELGSGRTENVPTMAPTTFTNHCDSNGRIITGVPVVRTKRYQELKMVLELKLRLGEMEESSNFDVQCSPHDLALTWMTDRDTLQPTQAAKIFQRFALAHFYFVTNMASTRLSVLSGQSNDTPWLTTDESECIWFGISCDEDNFITAIKLSEEQLMGQIPNELLILLPYLRILDLSANEFNTRIPLSLYSSPRLEYVNLAENQLSGSIDETKWTTTNLESLVLAENQFMGTIPASIGALTKLLELNLQFNRFTGPIPEEIFNAPNLKKLLLSLNKLTGNYPKSMTTTLEIIALNGNDLRGKFPEAIFELTNLVKLDMADSQLSGTLPELIGNLFNLDVLSLEFNTLEGMIPKSITSISTLSAINLGSNILTGSIPMGFGQLSKLVFLLLDDNDLSGNVPTELGKLKSLEHLHLDLNEKLTGEIPPEICNLTEGGLSDLRVDCQICTSSSRCCSECNKQ